MDPLLKSDIFFFISSISVIFITVAVVIGVYFILGVIKDIKALIRSVRMEVESFKSKRRGVEVSGKTALKFLKLLALMALRRK